MYTELIVRSSKGVAVILFAGAMATLLHSESRRLYSWWWDSHNTPKNSKWLQDNLTDIDAKVKTMIKLIEEDADSFARRAEMYYKKRPELMKLVEEFYRAYRALAERYNHTTGELRHAHRTIARAFPDQVPQELIEDSSSPSKDKDLLQVLELQCPGESLFDHVDSVEDARNKGLKQLSKMFEAKESVLEILKSEEVKRLRAENQSLKEKVFEERERADRGEIAIKGLEKELSDVEAEKENFFVEYQRCLEKLSTLEEELANAEEQSLMLNGKSIRAEIEIQALREGLIKLEAEKNDELKKRDEYLSKISLLEAIILQAEIEMKKTEGKESEAEAQALALKSEILRLELEKESVVDQYRLSLEKISDLENVISARELEAKAIKKRAEEAETEVSDLKRALAELHKEKETSAFKYKCCLEEIAKLEKDLSALRDEIECLKANVKAETAKLKTAEDNLRLLEMSNRSLQSEASDLAEKILKKDLELSMKQEELVMVQTCLENDHSRHARIEITLQELQNLHAQSQEDQRVLAVELKYVLRMLEDMEALKQDLESEIKQARDENRSLNDANLSSASSLEHMQDEVLSLRQIKERLEMEVAHHMSTGMSLQNEIIQLKEDIKGLSGLYGALIEQVEASGLDSKCLESSISSLRDENSKLREVCEEGNTEKAKLRQELERMEEMLKEKAVLENSVAELNNVLEESQAKVKAVEASCQSLQSEKASLFSEKASILSQLQAVTESMRNLLEKNAVLENSLSSAKVEVEVLREKSKGLAEICKMIKQERSYLLTERDVLVSKLENVERKHEILEKRFMGLEEKYADIEKEKESIYNQVEKLELSLALEKKEQVSFQLLSETRLVQLESQICNLREENIRKKTEFEEELEKTIRAQFERSILQRFMKDLEEKNYALIVECQKHVEASKLAEKVISELEGESLEQQVETEMLLDEIEGLRLGIYQIFKCLAEVDSSFSEPQEKTEKEQIFVDHIVESIEGMKLCISKQEDGNQQLLVENLVLVALIDQLHVKGMEVEAQKMHLKQELDIVSEKLDAVCNEKEKVIEMNERLKSDLNESHRYTATVEAELSSLCTKQDDLQKAYDVIKEAYSLVERENAYVLEKFSALKEEKYMLDQLNDSTVLESLKTANESEVLRSFASEKVGQIKALLEDLIRQQEVNGNLVTAMSAVREKLVFRETENLVLKDAISSLETKTQTVRDCNAQMELEILIGKECLIQAESKLAKTEEKLAAAETLNSTLFSTVDRLKHEVYESNKIIENQEFTVNQLSEKDLVQTKEIRSLKTANLKLESEQDFLRDELQEREIREQNLHCDLEEMNDEFELWEAEAATFYFDLQVSSIRDVLFENKVHELTEACKNLQDDNAVKTSDIVAMDGTICSMESEISRLKSQIEEYPRAMASLEHDVAFLERFVMLQAKIKASKSQKPAIVDIGTDLQTSASEVQSVDRSLLTLKDIQTRVKTVCKLMEEMNSPISRRRLHSKNGYESEIDQIKPVRELSETPKLRRLKSKTSESRDRLLLKDIPLDQVSNNNSLRRTHVRNNIGSDDQMLELWEAAAEDGNKDRARTSFRANGNDSMYNRFEDSTRKFEPPSTDSDIEKEFGLEKRSGRTAQEVDDSKILAKLFSDAERLETLQKTVHHLRRKFESVCKKKSSHRRASDVDMETVLKQLAEAEDSIVQLVDFNCQLVKNIEECPAMDQMASPRVKETSRMWRMKVDEHAQKGSERIKCLQVETQKIQYALLKIEDDDDGKKVKGKNVFLRNRSVVLRDFIYNGRRNSGRRKKGPFCGCFKEQSSMNRK